LICEGRATEEMQRLEVLRSSVAISHEEEYVIATVIIEK
jgi:phosphopantetheinyl transferase (holo-ACP synthase)